jgi:hypothetical protein
VLCVRFSADSECCLQMSDAGTCDAAADDEHSQSAHELAGAAVHAYVCVPSHGD